MDLVISIHRIRKAYQVLAIQGDFKGFKAKPLMVNNYCHLKQGQLPPLNSGPSPNFHHSKKPKT